MITVNGDVHISYIKTCDDETVELPEGAVLIAMTEEERDQVLAALRLWQHVKAEDIPLEIQEIACNGRECSLNDSEIDELCEDING